MSASVPLEKYVINHAENNHYATSHKLQFKPDFY